MQWFRMYHEFATDPKVQMLSETDQRRYTMLLCLRCCNGDVTLQEQEIAFQLRISPQEWQATKTTLLSKNLISEDGKPTAWDKRQYVSDSSAARVSKHREKLKQGCNVTVTAPDQTQIPDTEKDQKVSKGGQGGSFKPPVRSKWNVLDHLSRTVRYECEDKAKKFGWDFQVAAGKYSDWVQENPPRNPEMGFPAWIEKFCGANKP